MSRIPNEDPVEPVEPFDGKDRDLGLDVPITRRDFLNSTLLASGALLLSANAPPLQATQGPTS